MRFLIVIPTLNEHKNIGTIYKKIVNLYKKANILFIDDNSDDGSKNEILDLKKEITILKEPSSVSFREPLRETFTNYNIDNNLVNRFKSGITFDNDQFNELLLYIKLVLSI